MIKRQLVLQYASNSVQDTSVMFKQYLPRLKAAQIDGFEGFKKLNLKFNQKRMEHNMD